MNNTLIVYCPNIILMGSFISTRPMVPHFLTLHLDQIINADDIRNMPWNSSFDHEVYGHFKVMQVIYRLFPDKKIRLNKIVEQLLEGQWYAAAIATLIWGGVNASTPTDKSKSNFHQVLSYPEDRLTDHLAHIQSLLRIGDLRKAFQLMQTDYKIPGVGYPFFTKLFYVLGAADDQIPVKPLLLDRWTINGYYAALLTLGSAKIEKFFPDQDIVPTPPGSIHPRSGQILTELYESYVYDLRSWAAELQVKPAHIQNFMFGEALNRNKVKHNPRWIVWRVILDHQKSNLL